MNSLDTEGLSRSSELRWRRNDAAQWLAKFSTVERVQGCGRVPVGAAVAVRVTTSEDGHRVAGFAGLMRCGSVWACPTCSARIARQRSDLLAEVLRRWHRDHGGRVAMVTLTVRHDRSQSLETVWDAVAKAWTAASNGKWWQEWGEKVGRLSDRRAWKIPYLRYTEVTWSRRNGWHVHVHALLFVRDVPELDALVGQLAGDMWEKWDKAAQKAGLRGGEQRHSDAHVVRGDGDAELSQYFSKAVLELTTGHVAKSGREGHLTPFGILGLLGDDLRGVEPLTPGKRSALRSAWAEWEQTSSGRRQMGWSHGLLAMLGLDSSWTPTDQEIVDAELDGEVVAMIEPQVWRLIVGAGLRVMVLDAFEYSTEAGLDVLERLRQQLE